MPVDIFLDYLINSTSSMPIHLDENIPTEFEDSWLWRHMTPHFSQNDDKDDFILNGRRKHWLNRIVRLNLSFGLEYALRSGKFGDAEGFLDTNILSCLDAARILYSDWTMLKERKSTGIFREFRCLSAEKMPLSNITNVRNKAQSSIKPCSRSADIPTLMKKQKCGPSPSGVFMTEFLSKKNFVN
ncbi:hypothetical protein GGU11DRAFT_803092 [Lentinula aff. detonsa]|nr:hypothetical protein GGU11DRAFT_803092 [Lentinula aff. detonsa]